MGTILSICSSCQYMQQDSNFSVVCVTIVPSCQLTSTTCLHPHVLHTGTGRFRFSHPSTQQHLLVWRDRPKVVMVIKKLGRELVHEFLEVRGDSNSSSRCRELACLFNSPRLAGCRGWCSSNSTCSEAPSCVGCSQICRQSVVEQSIVCGA